MHEVKTIQELLNQISRDEILLPGSSAATSGTAIRCAG